LQAFANLLTPRCLTSRHLPSPEWFSASEVELQPLPKDRHTPGYLFAALAPGSEITMNTGIHAIRWGVPRLAIGLGLTVMAILLTYSFLVFIIVVVQAAGVFGQQ
jgi:hypothetical protein